MGTAARRFFGWVCIAAATPAPAAGGAHVVDDAAVEAPGVCHLDSFLTIGSDDGRVAVLAPGCTALQLPTIEFGGFVAHAWAPGGDETIAGLSTKFLLVPESEGIGVAASTAIGFDLDRGRFETAAIVVPVTLPIGRKLRLNVNAGWQWFGLTDSHDIFGGAQAEYQLTPSIGLMAEAIARDVGKAGGQMGVRWTVARGTVDLDLLAGRYADGASRNSITLGITIRR